MFMMPPIVGKPMLLSPDFMLSWPLDRGALGPSVMEPTANYVNDLHAEFGGCDIVLSSSGNYHMALHDLWFTYLDENAQRIGIKHWFYSTSPPVVISQLQNHGIQLGNIRVVSPPQVAVGPLTLMQDLTRLGFKDGNIEPILKSRGNVLLVRRGNPKNIQSVWDLMKEGVRLVTPNPGTEPGTFKNFVSTLYNLACNDGACSGGVTADQLFNAVFNEGMNAASTINHHWFTGHRVMHREIPWAINADKADVAIIFYHLARYFKAIFPDIFDFLPLGGTMACPDPLPGNAIETLYATRIIGQWNKVQLAARECLMEALLSAKFDNTLAHYGLLRPE